MDQRKTQLKWLCLLQQRMKSWKMLCEAASLKTLLYKCKSILSIILENSNFLNNKIPSVLSIQAFTVNKDKHYLVFVLFYV